MKTRSSIPEKDIPWVAPNITMWDRCVCGHLRIDHPYNGGCEWCGCAWFLDPNTSLHPQTSQGGVSGKVPDPPVVDDLAMTLEQIRLCPDCFICKNIRPHVDKVLARYRGMKGGEGKAKP